jgi:hypothetical protein
MTNEKQKVISTLDKNELNKVINETHETVATNHIEESLNGKLRKFSVVDMWNLQRKQRTTSDMRRWLN